MSAPRASGVPDDDALDVREILHLPRRADQILLTAALDVARADVGIVLSERIEHLAEGHTGGALHISHPMARLGD